MDERLDEEGATPAGDGLSLAVAERLSDLMAKRGVPIRQQAGLLAELCGLSLSQARRKLRGAVWSFAEVVAVARRFGVSLDAVLADSGAQGVAVPGASAGVPLQEARFVAGDWSGPCQVRLGALASEQAAATLLAARRGADWLVGTPAGLMGENAERPFYRADQVVLTPPAETLPTRIAVLDDEAATAETLCEYFAAMGYSATAYTSADEFRAAPLAEHDAFVVDFMLAGGDSSQAIIADIRRALPDAPILLLTGKLRDGQASEADLTTVLRTANVRFFEKPVRPGVLAAAIESCLDQTAGRKAA